MSLRVGIIGCGLIGHKRAQSLGKHTLVACADLNFEKAQALAKLYKNCKAFSDWQALLKEELDVVIVATPHDGLSNISAAACEAGKHVLVEKPAGRTPQEIQTIIEAAEKSKVLVRVGFNHRYHRAFQKARALVDENALGPLMFVRARYGHGGRLGYNKEWRADPKLSGGGELIDQGVHLIDLAGWFLGEFKDIQGFAHTYYWDMPVDDNGFLLLKTADQKTAFLHASCTEWKNIFSFEIYGQQGKLHIEGLGGSYGVEKLTFYKMLPEMGPPETQSWEYPMKDNSWDIEFAEFCEDIRLQRQPAANLEHEKAALTVVNTIYKESGYDHNP
jgi:predicted dehydrogenase